MATLRVVAPQLAVATLRPSLQPALRRAVALPHCKPTRGGALSCRAGPLRAALTSSVGKAAPPLALLGVTIASAVFSGIAAVLMLVGNSDKLEIITGQEVVEWRAAYERALWINRRLAAFCAVAGAIGAVCAAANGYPGPIFKALAVISATFAFIWANTVKVADK